MESSIADATDPKTEILMASPFHPSRAQIWSNHHDSWMVRLVFNSPAARTLHFRGIEFYVGCSRNKLAATIKKDKKIVEDRVMHSTSTPLNAPGGCMKPYDIVVRILCIWMR
jgi:hypothetical protein